LRQMRDTANLDRSPQGCIETESVDEGRKMTGRAQWYPTSDQKQVRYGAPVVRLHEENSKEGFFTSCGARATQRFA
jgi:hypothetical protein